MVSGQLRWQCRGCRSIRYDVRANSHARCGRAAGVPDTQLPRNGIDTHSNAGDTTLAYYGGASPWTGGALTQSLAPVASSPTAGTPAYTPEQWAALVDGSGQGLTVYVPGAYPWAPASSFPAAGGTRPTDSATVYMAPTTMFMVAPAAVIEGDIYLLPGDVAAARAVGYALHQRSRPTTSAHPGPPSIFRLPARASQEARSPCPGGRSTTRRSPACRST